MCAIYVLMRAILCVCVCGLCCHDGDDAAVGVYGDHDFRGHIYGNVAGG